MNNKENIIIINCKTCNSIIHVFPCLKNRKKYCSKECFNISKKGIALFRGRRHSKKSRKKMSKIRKGRKAWNKGLIGFRLGEKRPGIMPIGENHWSWKGGISRNIHSTKEPKYRAWRTSVFTRDKFTCRIADVNCDGQLQAHHILRWAEYPELRYDINNGITLCQAHHPRKRAEEKRLIPTFVELVSVSK